MLDALSSSKKLFNNGTSTPPSLPIVRHHLARSFSRPWMRAPSSPLTIRDRGSRRVRHGAKDEIVELLPLRTDASSTVRSPLFHRTVNYDIWQLLRKRPPDRGQVTLAVRHRGRRSRLSSRPRVAAV
ncbi:hypothetical protein CERZMDRAFT_83546 [Cercospora zeae-maydis SCOH1-5]|uniref:Uncharacterized protein n=1 Tax=Cercospora zeae-maydis SCOH1-5 TaxID=717836 RepID=A0A6A6FLJ0_9PEZI|nr:hypothetical protein CERZMDRAFT_83546 [Cercospora zeae-maydis SCOH1-5]